MTVEQPLSACQCELPHGQTSPSVAAELRGEARETERIGGDGADVILRYGPRRRSERGRLAASPRHEVQILSRSDRTQNFSSTSRYR